MKDDHNMLASKVWACTAAGGACASFVSAALPWLQFLAVVISIVAGIQSLRSPRK